MGASWIRLALSAHLGERFSNHPGWPLEQPASSVAGVWCSRCVTTRRSFPAHRLQKCVHHAHTPRKSELMASFFFGNISAVSGSDIDFQQPASFCGVFSLSLVLSSFSLPFSLYPLVSHREKLRGVFVSHHLLHNSRNLKKKTHTRLIESNYLHNDVLSFSSWRATFLYCYHLWSDHCSPIILHCYYEYSRIYGYD